MENQFNRSFIYGSHQHREVRKRKKERERQRPIGQSFPAQPPTTSASQQIEACLLHKPPNTKKVIKRFSKILYKVQDYINYINQFW